MMRFIQRSISAAGNASGRWRKRRNGMPAREKPKTIREIMKGMSDQELIEMLPYIRDENGEKVSLIELKHYLNER